MLRNYQKRSFLLALFVWPLGLVFGQFNIVPVPAGNIYLKSQLWNLSVSNTGTGTVQARINANMKDVQTNLTVLSAMTGFFTLPPGMRAVQMQSLEPILYNYGSGMVPDRSADGMLPLGKYQVCYQLILVNGENQTIIADDCEEIEVEPLSPPLLSMPENDSLVQTANPSFTWTPPTPMAMFGDLNYDLLISELNDGQSITDAIQKNLPFQQAQGLQQPFFSYPLQGPQLEEGKNYVWQIVARDRQQYAAKSEVWIFRMPDKKIIPPLSSLVYLVMDDKSNGGGVIDPGILHLKYISSATAHQASILIKDENGSLLQTAQLPIRQGDNYLDIPLNGRFQSKHNYTAIIQDTDGKTSSLAFTIK
jgi:hypothetical protein